MSIEIVTGPPGSGKTTYVLEKLREADIKGDKALLFLSADARQIRNSKSLWENKTLCSRNGETCHVDYIETTERTIKILQELIFDGTAILIFEEAQYFSQEILKLWENLSNAGHNVLVSTPTLSQVKQLKTIGASIMELKTNCCLLSDGDATNFFVLPETGVTLSVCDDCAKILTQRARERIYQLLIEYEPHPGEKRVYQPTDLEYPEFSELDPIRQDSNKRAELMYEHVNRTIGKFEPRTRSFIDIGCNTGFLCKKMADIGFISRGVDIVPGDIRIGKLLDAYFYRRYIDFICHDAVDFIMGDKDTYDITSTFSVFQWLYLQTDKELVDKALIRLYEKAKSLVFFEIGYTAEKHYQERLKINIDRDWVNNVMRNSGLFKEVILYEESEYGLKRDFFVGIKK